MRRKSMTGVACPIARSLDVIGDWWSLLIVRDAFLGLRRFGEFEKSLGVSKNILTQRLRALVNQGIFETVPAADGSAYFEYVLTAKGQDLFVVISALRQWGSEHLFDGNTCGTLLVDREKGEPVGRLELHAADGRLLAPQDTQLKVVA